MSNIQKFLTFSISDIVFFLLFISVFVFIYWLKKRFGKMRLPIVSKFDEQGLWYSPITGKNKVSIKITTSSPSTVKVIFSDTEIAHYDQSEDSVDFIQEFPAKKEHDIIIPASEKFRYVFIYCQYGEYVLFEKSGSI